MEKNPVHNKIYTTVFFQTLWFAFYYFLTELVLDHTEIGLGLERSLLYGTIPPLCIGIMWYTQTF